MLISLYCPSLNTLIPLIHIINVPFLPLIQGDRSDEVVGVVVDVAVAVGVSRMACGETFVCAVLVNNSYGRGAARQL